MENSANQRVKRTQRDYTLAFKRSVVQQVEQGRLTYKQAQRQYGIQGRSTVLVWLRKLGSLDWHYPPRQPLMVTPAPPKLPTPEQRIKEPQRRTARSGPAGGTGSGAGLPDLDRGGRERAWRGDPKKGFPRTVQRLQAERSAARRQMSLAYICQLFGVSRQGYYQAQQRQQASRHLSQQVSQLVQAHRRLMPRLGTRKLYHLIKASLAQQGLKLGRDGLFSLLRATGELIRPLRSYHKTTDSTHWMHRYSNLIKELVVNRQNQLWVADITHLDLVDGHGYLSLVTDAYSRRIMGYHVHDRLQVEPVRLALEMALAQGKLTQPLIHHSDRGSQYCAEHYQKLHRKHHIQCSMTDGYDCYQNALAERINGILKYEFLLIPPQNLSEARQMAAESVAIYNQRRPHLSLQYQTPDQVHFKPVVPGEPGTTKSQTN